MPEAAIEQELFCPECGYNLRGLTSDRCPECGFDITAIRSGQSELPWLKRRQIGGMKAYWRTVFWVMFQPRRFVIEMARPIRERDARRFRAWTLAHVVAAMLLLEFVLAWFEPKFFLEPAQAIGWWFVVLAHAGILLGLVAVTSAPYYAMRHRNVPIERSYRAAVLSFYACAPLAWSFLPAMLFGAATALSQVPRVYTADLALFVVGVGLLLGMAITSLSDLHRLIGKMLAAPGPTAWIIVKTLALAGAGFFLAAVGIPLFAVMLAVVYYSLS
jgi:hypothetical protein